MNKVGGYTVIGRFECCGRNMVVIKAAHGTHVMSEEDWEN